MHTDGWADAVFLDKVCERWHDLLGIILGRDDRWRGEKLQILQENSMCLII